MRTALSRLFLVALLGVAVFAVVRLTAGASGALVDFDSLDPDGLDHRSFVLAEPGTLAVDAAGSYEEMGTPASDTTMAAFGWIVRRDDGALVWRMHPPRPDRGTLVSVADTITLPAGTYDVYFASYGDPDVRAEGPRDGSLTERLRAFLSRGGRSWVGEAARWRFRLDPVNAAARRATEPADPEDPARAETAPDSLLLWEARGVRNRQHRDVLISVETPAEVVVRTMTEVVDGEIRDRPSIIRLGRRDTIWTASAEESVWAGGALKNRIIETRVALEPGIYQVAFDADRTHGYDGWTANPPWRPWQWGVSLSRATPAAAVSRLDPTALDLPVLAALECVGPDQDRQLAVTVAERTDVLVVAVGEIDSGSHYDWASIDRQDDADWQPDDWDDADWEEVWEMRDDLDAAGGAEKNRRAVHALSLEPGTYRLRYRTDGTHDCESGYEGDAPAAPLWGAVLYALDPSADPAAFDAREIRNRADEGEIRNRADEVLPMAEDPEFSAWSPLAAIDRVGDGEDRRTALRLAAPTDVRVIAAGEISSSGRYDYATIERDGRIVWEMTYANTRPASDNLYHRQFDGVVSLDAGLYELRYRTDDSRSVGDFGPRSETLWGAQVYGPEEEIIHSAPGTDLPDQP